MRVAFGCDHRGYPLKEAIIQALEQDGHVVLDLGTFSDDPVDYPDCARAVGNAVRNQFADVGILVCGSGVGAAIAANKLAGVRAALCHDLFTARQSREDDDANILCLGARVLPIETAIAITRAWVAAEFSGEERHVRRLAKIAGLEGGSPPPSTRTVSARTQARPTIWRGEKETPPRPVVKPEPAVGGTVPAARALEGEMTAETGAGARFARLAEAALGTLEERAFVKRLWINDASVWTKDQAQQEVIRNRLGWLTSPTLMRERCTDLREFADEVRRSNYTHVLLLGMGGATLCPEVLAQTFGVRTGFPGFILLDSTDPGAVNNALSRVNLPRTLFVVSSKSGATAETLAFYSFFRDQVERVSRGKPGLQFVAITDSGTPLERLARAQGFRKVFLNPPTIGGRFSGLSYFGLVPGALAGVDVTALLARAVAAVSEAGESIPIRNNPGIVRGAKLAAWAKAGRDKVTFVFPPPLAAFGAWLEQLLAESLGKSGQGLLPVDGEPLDPPEVYGQDRCFVAMSLAKDAGTLEPGLASLEAAGHPVLRITLPDLTELGAEFYRWEIATATVGALLEVNPFDEPNVQEAKDLTVELLGSYRISRRLPEWPVDREEEGVALLTGAGTKPLTVSEGLAAHLRLARPGDYLAFLVYLPPRTEITGAVQELRRVMREKLGLAVTVGYGPRYLHSTGQLHKGGPPNGLFIQITADDRHDLPVPGQPFTFSVLKNAQALGDLRALRNKGRRVIRVHLGGKDPAETLKRLTSMLARAAAALR